jgi:photosynthetic reaction center cytochrome c subunit
VNLLFKAGGGLFALLLTAGTISAFKSTAVVQKGNAGLAMETIEDKANLPQRIKDNQLPPVIPYESKGDLAVDAYKNVQVLGHLTTGQMTGLMNAMALWVAPNDGGCAYCHAPLRDATGKVVKSADGTTQVDPNNLQSDELYAKRVARRMLEMTLRINGDWKQHVQGTGVTCYTCHRGNPVPKYIWFDQPESDPEGMLGYNANQNSPAAVAGVTSLPGDALQTFLETDENIRIQSTHAVDDGNRASIKQAEWTYALMIHMSNALGVNCTYCHNTRSMGEWSTSPATRAQAWYGIRMVRELNGQYLLPLARNGTLPANRLGSFGDGPKVNCATCHQRAYKPLLGQSLLGDYPMLAQAMPQPAKTVVAAASAAASATNEPPASPAEPVAVPPQASAVPAPSATPASSQPTHPAPSRSNPPRP